MADAWLFTLALLVPLGVVLLAMPPYLRRLTKSGWVSDDAHKRPPTKVPEPAGPVLFLGAAVGEILVYLLYPASYVPLAVFGAASIAFAVGIFDDVYVLGAKTKPLLLILASLPLVGLVMLQPDLYTSVLVFPVLGQTSPHFLIYTILVMAAFPVVANAFNMMDSFNGQISGFSLLSSLAMLLAVVLEEFSDPTFSPARVASVLPLVAVSAGFLVFNRYPSKAFDGDSGSLMFGAMFAALAVTGGVEIAAIVAILPAILNSFYILYSVRGFVERRRMSSRPTYIGEDGRLYASPELNAPSTLVRMLLLDGPLTEQQLVKALLAVTAAGCVLSAVTSIMTWVL